MQFSILPMRSLLIFSFPPILVLLTLAATYTFTTVRYRLALRNNDRHDATDKPVTPAHIPFTLPFLGSALSFLAPYPGRFWAYLFSFHPRDTGVCTILLGGRTTHILFSPSAIQALFKTKPVSRQVFNVQVVQNGFGMPATDTKKFYGGTPEEVAKGIDSIALQEDINHEYLLKQDAVNELTTEFTKFMRDELNTVSTGVGSEWHEVNLYAWLKGYMFKASTTAFMGSRIFEIYPSLGPDFFAFDTGMLSLFFGIPRFFIPKVYQVRRKVLDGLERWNVQMSIESKTPADPHSAERWEPRFGSRVNRARQIFYEQRGLSFQGRAGIDLGFLFGLSSNAIPATGWMLMHILDPKADRTLMPRVMAEIKTARLSDGTLDVPTLIALPLMQSLYHETLRLYMDVLVSRVATEDIVLPFDHGSGRQQKVLFKKSSTIMVPSWLGHHDVDVWTNPSCETFYPERFLKFDAETGKDIFTTSNTAGKFFPFGGGRSICPGRVFAKQEVLASVAMFLLGFDFEVLGYVDEKGKEMRRFPGLRKTYPGSGIMPMDGDLKVRMRRREKSST